MTVYPIGSSGQRILLDAAVIEYLRRQRQLLRHQAEAGGQLFARIDGNDIHIVEATGPRRTDRRSRTSYVPDRKAEQAEIAERHSRGLQFVGDWHTHPDVHPKPSGRDLESMAECVAKSEHCFNGFLLLIVGQADSPEGWHASIHDGKSHFALSAASV